MAERQSYLRRIIALSLLIAGGVFLIAAMWWAVDGRNEVFFAINAFWSFVSISTGMFLDNPGEIRNRLRRFVALVLFFIGGAYLVTAIWWVVRGNLFFVTINVFWSLVMLLIGMFLFYGTLKR